MEWDAIEGESPVGHESAVRLMSSSESRVAWDCSPKVGGKLHLRLNNGERPIANKYREGKMKRTLKRESKVRETVKREALEQSIAALQFSVSCLESGLECHVSRCCMSWACTGIWSAVRSALRLRRVEMVW